jgi:hypothetical protein
MMHLAQMKIGMPKVPGMLNVKSETAHGLIFKKSFEIPQSII